MGRDRQGNLLRWPARSSARSCRPTWAR